MTLAVKVALNPNTTNYNQIVHDMLQNTEAETTACYERKHRRVKEFSVESLQHQTNPAETQFSEIIRLFKNAIGKCAFDKN